MNIWIGEGRLVRDIELMTSNTGKEYCKFTVAVNRRTGKDQEKKADFIDCSAFGKTAAFIANYFHKGDGILVRGRLESDTYEAKDGTRRTKWGISVADVEFPQGSKRDSGSDSKPIENAEGFPDVDPSDVPF